MTLTQTISDPRGSRRAGFLAAVAAAVLVGGFGCTPETGHRSFATPDAALAALIAALEANDDAALRAIFGPDADALISSGDPVADGTERKGFLASYGKRHALVDDGADRKVLEIGEDAWPMPIPLVKRDGGWQFDGAAGADELVYRRIGVNELGAIAVLQGIVEAQAEYVAANPEQNAIATYAAKLKSDPGRRNGLYWETKEGEPPSPAGPFLAEARAEGYTDGSGVRTPYHGYFFRLLTAQGPAAPGGAKPYLVDDRLTGGFGVVAFPAEYRASGVMTFVVNQDGVVFQKDLGEDTEKVALAMTAFDPGEGWTRVD